MVSIISEWSETGRHLSPAFTNLDKARAWLEA